MISVDGEHLSKPDIIEMPEPLGIFAGELFDRGKEYLIAFQRLAGDKPRADLPFASYFLVSHALELLLKSYLVANGTTKKDIRGRELGHDLSKLMERCLETGIPHVDHLSEFARAIAEMNSDHDFRYPSGYNLSVPNPRMCLEVAWGLEQAIKHIVSQASVAANIQFASETRHLIGKKIRWSD